MAQIGEVYKVPLTKEDQITPKDGYSTRNKYCIVIGTPDYGYYVAYLIIDHEINFTYNTTKEDIDGFYPIFYRDYPEFLKPEYSKSWVDMNTVRELTKERLNQEGILVGTMNDQDLGIILDELRNSRRHSNKSKRRWGLIP